MQRNIAVPACDGTDDGVGLSTNRAAVHGPRNPGDLAVDAAGNVYVTDTHRVKVDNGFPNVTTRVIKLPAGSNAQTVLPQFVHAQLTTDPAGAVWVIDTGNEKLVKLAAGTDTQTVLPLPQPDPACVVGYLQSMPPATPTASTVVACSQTGDAVCLSR